MNSNLTNFYQLLFIVSIWDSWHNILFLSSDKIVAARSPLAMDNTLNSIKFNNVITLKMVRDFKKKCCNFSNYHLKVSKFFVICVCHWAHWQIFYRIFNYTLVHLPRWFYFSWLAFSLLHFVVVNFNLINNN